MVEDSFKKDREDLRIAFSADLKPPEGAPPPVLLRNEAPRQLENRATSVWSALLQWVGPIGSGLLERLSRLKNLGAKAFDFSPAAWPGEGPLDVVSLFGEDYWPERARPSSLRLAVCVLLAPLASLAPTLLLALLLYWISEPGLGAAFAMTIEAAAEFFSALYGPMLLGAVFGGASLWALRLRSRRAFAACGAGLGALGGVAVYLVDGALPMVAAIFTLCAGALSMLALRWSAGVRKLD